MFEEILGVPAHPLLLHAAVVFIPLQIAAALAYALVPFLRRHIWWLVAALAVAGPITGLIAKLSGDALLARFTRNKIRVPDGLSVHRSYATMTVWWATGLGLLMLILLLLRRRPTVEASSAGEPGATAKGPMVLTLLVTLGAVVLGGILGYYIFKTGDTGAHMVWRGL